MIFCCCPQYTFRFNICKKRLMNSQSRPCYSIIHYVGWLVGRSVGCPSVCPSVGSSVVSSHFVFFFAFFSLKVENTDGLTGMLSYRIACTGLLAIGLVFYDLDIGIAASTLSNQCIINNTFVRFEIENYSAALGCVQIRKCPRF